MQVNSLNDGSYDGRNDDEDFETTSNLEAINANDDSGGGSYEDSNPMQGSSHRNSLEKDDDYDDDEEDVDVISTDVSCYDQLLGNRNDDLTIVVSDDLIKVNGGDGIYANPFVDDEGIAESGM